MKVWSPIRIAVILSSLLAGGVALAETEQKVTSTLLPDRPTDGAELWIRNHPKVDAYLRFDLNALPEGIMRFERCQLTLVAKEIVYRPKGDGDWGASAVSVGIQLASDDRDTASSMNLLNLQPERTKGDFVVANVASGSSEELCRAVLDKYNGTGERVLWLRASAMTRNGCSLFHSNDQSNDQSDPSNIPRLVLTYAQRRADLQESAGWGQLQHDPEHTGRQSWSLYGAVPNYTATTVAQGGVIAQYPVSYREHLYVLRTKGEGNYICRIDFGGAEVGCFSTTVPGTVQRQPVVSRNGWFYVVTDSAISAYDLNDGARLLASYVLSGRSDSSTRAQKLSGCTNITMGNDGSLYLSLLVGGLNYIYGLKPMPNGGQEISLRPFLKLGPFARTSTISTSPDGAMLYLQTERGHVEISVSNPATSATSKKGRQSTASDVQNWMDDAEVAPAGQSCSAIQTGSDLKTTSNRVEDNSGRIYFFKEGHLQICDSNGKCTQRTQGKAPQEKNLRLLLGADGTLWTRNNGDIRLIVFRPDPVPELKLAANDLRDRTSYWAQSLSIDGGQVKGDTQLILQASQNIRFSRGFEVRRGASLLARVLTPKSTGTQH